KTHVAKKSKSSLYQKARQTGARAAQAALSVGASLIPVSQGLLLTLTRGGAAPRPPAKAEGLKDGQNKKVRAARPAFAV
ncbi:hypothetical protein, partial [Mesorhizobium sp.]|uniref:hypothetical protein n=1 Tax=Mesorhizobium sp. TaxID=1871066 RepID=UPI0025809DAD